MSKALGMIETKGLVGSIEAADAMLKAAQVTLLSQEMVDAALVTIFIEGDVSAVQAAVESGKEAASRVGTVVSHFVIPHPDIETKELIKKKKIAIKPRKHVEAGERKEKQKTNPTNSKVQKKQSDAATDEQ